VSKDRLRRQSERMFKMNVEQRNYRLDLAKTQLARSAREADSEIAAAAARRPTGRAVLEPLPILPTAAALHCRCARSQGFAGLLTGHPIQAGSPPELFTTSTTSSVLVSGSTLAEPSPFREGTDLFEAANVRFGASYSFSF